MNLSDSSAVEADAGSCVESGDLLAALRAGTLLSEPGGRGLIGANLSGADLGGLDLSGLDLSRADLTGANLLGARLEGSTLFETNLTEAELSGANLSGANLGGANLTRAGVGMANLAGASLAGADLTGATLTNSDLSGADLRVAVLDHARLREVDLRGADLSRAILTRADLEDSQVEGATLDAADLRGADLARLGGYEQASWIGVDIRDIDFTGAYLCRRFIMDQNFLDEFKRTSRLHKLIFSIWSLTSDCGRSALRWSCCTAVIVLLFTWVYTFVAIDYGDYETSISPLYYSVVTMTTLGYGDVLPATVGAQVVAMIQVVLGYVMLGGLLSIFSNKMASRAT